MSGPIRQASWSPHAFELTADFMGGLLSSAELQTEKVLSQAPITVHAKPVGKQVTKPQTEPAKNKPITTASVIRDLTARLKVVEREIKARNKLEAERSQIKRLLNAAKQERNTVRDLRSVG